MASDKPSNEEDPTRKKPRSRPGACLGFPRGFLRVGSSSLGTLGMRIDLGMVAQLGAEMGFAVRDATPDEVGLVLEPNVVLVFENLSGPSDSLVGFDGFGWHFHGDLQCSDKQGCFVELSYLDIITGLADGTVLVCELVVDGRPQDRWLVHRDYVDEFRYMDAGEEIRVRRIKVGGCRAGREVPNLPQEPPSRDQTNRES